MKLRIQLLFSLLIAISSGNAQMPEKPTSAEIFKKIKRCNFLGSVLYVAAHPDDENTRLISHFSSHEYARTAYLSLTRGDGGQNLIGPEIREELGYIRTYELTTAREIDGGEQYFSRANDFGYSKHPDETMEIWEEDEILSDVVWVFRKFRPDIIVNRFDHRSPGKTHGHHTASAMLSLEAFDISGDAKKFPEQIQYFDAWKPKSVYFNTSWWFYGSQEKFDEADKSKMIAIPTGMYDPLTGLSNLEVASLSRSQHKSQGFGNTGSRGESVEYLELVGGDMPPSMNGLFEGINTSWSRLEGGEAIGEIMYKVEREYDFTNPSNSVADLLEALKLARKLDDTFWRDLKTKEIVEIIVDCLGLYIEPVARQQSAVAGEVVTINLEVVNRSMQAVKLLSAAYTQLDSNYIANVDLGFNQKLEKEFSISIARDAEYSSPYWLKEPASLGMYKVDDQLMRGYPEQESQHQISFVFQMNDVLIEVNRPIVYKFNDPVKGEVHRPFVIVPIANLSFADDVFVFADDQPTTIAIEVGGEREGLNGAVHLKVPEGWKCTPESIEVRFEKRGEKQRIQFELTPPQSPGIGDINAYFEYAENLQSHKISKEVVQIEYDHIPHLTIVRPSSARVVKLEVETRGKKVGYIEGAGDIIPQSLEQLGYEVTTLITTEITAEALKEYDAVVLGVRAYNTNEDLNFKQKELFEYVKNGGTVVVQYNTSHRVNVDEVAPYELKLSRDRVTDEFADVKILAPDHPVMNEPNKITSKDFDGWVQERGLYFPNEWSDNFTPILSCHDKGEEDLKGGLLVAKHGEGYFVYTAYSWFRQFPAGVPGAYRIFANMVSLGK